MLISEALEGKYVKSSQGQGIIQFAEKRDNISTAEHVFAYACSVRPTWNGTGYPKSDFYTTVYVAVDS